MNDGKPNLDRTKAISLRGKKITVAEKCDHSGSEAAVHIPKIRINDDLTENEQKTIADDPPTPHSAKSLSPESVQTANSGKSISLTSPMSTTASLAQKAMNTLRLRKSVVSRRGTIVSHHDSSRRMQRQRTRARLFHPKEVIGCDPWATWLLAICTVVFLLSTICLLFAICNDGGSHEQTQGAQEAYKILYNKERARAGNLEKMLFETFEIIGIQVYREQWENTVINPSEVEKARRGELWRKLHDLTHTQDRSQGLNRLNTSEASKKIRAMVKDLPKLKEISDRKTLPEGTKMFKYKKIEIPCFSDENSKYHRMANVALLRSALKNVRDRMTWYSDRSSRVRLNLVNDCPTHQNLLSILEEVHLKVPMDRQDYWHVARFGGNLVSQAVTGTFNMLNPFTCGASQVVDGITQTAYNRHDLDATKAQFGPDHRTKQPQPVKRTEIKIPEAAEIGERSMYRDHQEEDKIKEQYIPGYKASKGEK